MNGWRRSVKINPNNFLETFFYKNVEMYKTKRGFLDAYVFFELMKFNNISNYMEIGCYKGALFSMVAETFPDSKKTLIDINFSKIKHTLPNEMFKNTAFIETMSEKVDFSGFDIFDLIVIDGNHVQPTPTIDVSNCLKKSSHDTVIFLDDYQWEGMEVTRSLLKVSGYKSWIKNDSGEFFSKKDLQPFVNHLLYKTPLTDFARINRKPYADDTEWAISTPKCVYDNVSQIENYINAYQSK